LKPVCPNPDKENMYSMILPDSCYQPHYQMFNGGYPASPLSVHETPAAPVTPKTVPSYSTVEPPYRMVQQSNGYAGNPTPSRCLPQTPSNLGVPYYPPPPQAVSASAGAEQTRSRRTSKDNSDPKCHNSQSFRPPVLRISMRSKVRI
jgi:hypothetical protein